MSEPLCLEEVTAKIKQWVEIQLKANPPLNERFEGYGQGITDFQEYVLAVLGEWQKHNVSVRRDVIANGFKALFCVKCGSIIATIPLDREFDVKDCSWKCRLCGYLNTSNNIMDVKEFLVVNKKQLRELFEPLKARVGLLRDGGGANAIGMQEILDKIVNVEKELLP